MNSLLALHRAVILTMAACSVSWLAAQRILPFEIEAEGITEETPAVYSIPAPRGLILDRKGRILAGNKAVFYVTVQVPKEQQASLPEFLQAVEGQLAKFPRDLEEQLASTTRQVLKNHYEHRRALPLVISQPLALSEHRSRPEELTTAGFGVRYATLRDYPQDTLASQLLGHLITKEQANDERHYSGEPLWRSHEGAFGIEKSFEERLRGEAGSRIVSYGDNRGEKTVANLRPAVPGENVVLTIDREIQQRVEDALARTGLAGAAVLLDASRGDILASASYPNFSPNQFIPFINNAEMQSLSADGRNPLYNRALSGLYPPASTIKPVTAMAALTGGGIYPHERVNCPPYMIYEGSRFRNWTQEESGYLNVTGALIRSNNPFFYQVANQVGERALVRAARAFGFGQRPRLPLGGVAAGSFPSRLRGEAQLANTAIGQGEVLASPLQVATMMGSFCTARYQVQPRLVNQVQAQSGRITKTYPARHGGRLQVVPEHLEYVANGLYGVVNHVDGTGRRARIPKLAVCGKTGTAQWRDNGEDKSAAWFAGFVRETSPPLAFAVVIEGTRTHSVSGGKNAAPVAKQFLRSILAEPDVCGVTAPQRSRPTREMRQVLYTPGEVMRAIPVSRAAAAMQTRRAETISYQP